MITSSLLPSANTSSAKTATNAYLTQSLTSFTAANFKAQLSRFSSYSYSTATAVNSIFFRKFSQPFVETNVAQPDTPTKRKKSVRFADSIGMDLVNVKYILEEDPFNIEQQQVEQTRRPMIITNAFTLNHLRESLEKYQNKVEISPPTPPSPTTINNTHQTTDDDDIDEDDDDDDDKQKFIIGNFSFEWSNNFTFALLNDEQNVKLTRLDVNRTHLSGCVNVRNVCYHKKVHVHYTFDNWKTKSALECMHTQHLGEMDTFEFSLSMDKAFIIKLIDENFNNASSKEENVKAKIPPRFRFEFSISYETRRGHFDDPHYDICYWDNNYNRNYFVDCFFKINSPVSMSSTNHNQHHRNRMK